MSEAARKKAEEVVDKWEYVEQESLKGPYRATFITLIARAIDEMMEKERWETFMAAATISAARGPMRGPGEGE